MLSVTRIGLSIVLLGALCGVASMPAVAQPDGLNGREQTVAELRELAERFKNEDMAALAAQAEHSE